MTVRFPRRVPARVLALGLVAALPMQGLAAPSTPARKTPSRKAPAKGDFQSLFSSAVRLYQKFEYEQALEKFTRARAVAKGVEQEVPVALYLGIVQAELGDRDASLASFRTGLYLQPAAQLPVKVSPRVERDFEEIRQAVLHDLGAAPPPTDRPEQPAADKSPELTAPPTASTAPPAYVSAGSERVSGRGSVLTLALLGTGAVAGGAAGFFGLQSSTNVRFARETLYYGERTERLRSAENQALAANILIGTASAAALGALAVFLFPNLSPASHPVASGGGSP
ncbi:hypothetical protein [Melittangium boletus]|uniref:Uncharacterized protein n=1 Tax=Melittangium boletus DSM 14713 TaxID=1294270 RepID=A0A250I7M6_9BACT|nr:hypothetical protein [Melittangium boletus]ATB27775.1 hypothetical protein MEBOL_001220 [Melittangium boletus DSM 14713]